MIRARLAFAAAALAFSIPALAVDSVKMLIPANPGGGWDTTGRELAQGDAGLGRGEERPVRQQGRRRAAPSASRSS